MLKKIIIFMLTNILAFSFEINEIRFDKEILKGKKDSKEFVVNNSNNNKKAYLLSIEGDENVKVIPKILQIKSGEKELFKIEVDGKKSKGEHQYYLVIKELKSPKEIQGRGVEILKTIKILQKYTVK